MTDVEELRRLLGDLVSQPPAAIGRQEAVQTRIAREARRRVVVRSVGAAGAAVVLALGAVTAGTTLRSSEGRSPDQLGTQQTATPTATSSAGPAPTVSAPPSATSTPAATTAPSATTGPAGLSVGEVTTELLLGNDVMATAFGSGRAPLVQAYPPGLYSLDSCLLTSEVPVQRALRAEGAARSWSWPAEIVVNQVVVGFASAAEAHEQVQQCTRLSRYESPLLEPLDLGDEAFLLQQRHDLYRSMHAGARIGRHLVLVEWRQGGRVPSTAPLERALAAAVAKAVGDPAVAPVAAAAQQPVPELARYLTRAGFPPLGGAFEWSNDRPGTESQLRCGGQNLPTAQPFPSRAWYANNGDSAIVPGVVLSIATSLDPTSGSVDFDTCRRGFATTTPVEGIGDEAFLVTDDLGHQETQLFIRYQATYLHLATTWVDPEDVQALGGAAFTAWQEARP